MMFRLNPEKERLRAVKNLGSYAYNHVFPEPIDLKARLSLATIAYSTVSSNRRWKDKAASQMGRSGKEGLNRKKII